MNIMNNTMCREGTQGCFHSTTNVPFYYSHAPSLVEGFPDHLLVLAAPILAYWSLSLFFHYLDISGWKWLEQYRIHDSAEVKARNRATRTQVVWAVLLQQLIQTLLGLFWMGDHVPVANHGEKMEDMARTLQPLLTLVVGEKLGRGALPEAVYFVYWWGIPTFQFLSAMCVFNLVRCVMLMGARRRFIIDTWQYFLHRLMHVNKFLYKQFHSWHHRLYVPYAFGSLYNHPVEGFLLDSLGAAVAESVTGMTTRQAMLLFCFSTFKTVDDHCGYNLPFDPLQMITGNNADYHDIHHQVSLSRRLGGCWS